MINIQLQLLQTLAQSEWQTTSQIAEQTKIQKQAAASALSGLSESGMVELRETARSSLSGFSSVEWRSRKGSLDNYLQQFVPQYNT
ncbi:MAG: hypothetical protein AAF402_10555 [Pseudomonadota bacterium]